MIDAKQIGELERLLEAAHMPDYKQPGATVEDRRFNGEAAANRLMAALYNAAPDLIAAWKELRGRKISHPLTAIAVAEIVDQAAAMQRRAVEAERERDALLEDKARLDWLERDMPTSLFRYRESECIGDVVQVGEGFTGKTLRAAIDSARKGAA